MPNGEPLVFAGSASNDSTAYALDASTGAKVWSFRVARPGGNDVGDGLTVSPPGNNGFADGIVYFASRDGDLYALNMATGTVVWKLVYESTAGTNGGRSTAALSGNELVFGTQTGVMAVNAVTGTEIWNSAKTVGTDTEVISSPLITGPAGHQVVIYGDLGGKVIVLSLASGQELYSFQTHGYITGSPADSDGNIVITSTDGFVYDFAVGGTNATAYPATTISAPADGSTIPYPGSGTSTQATVTASGTASSANSCNGVLVAVRENGADGPYWNAATGAWQPGPAWNQAALGSGGTCASGWSFPAPVGRQGGVLEIFARATDADGEVDPTGMTSTVTVTPATTEAQLTLGSATAQPGTSDSVSGTGFAAGEKVQISLPGAALATTTATSSGSFSSVTVPLPRAYPVGLSGVTATGQTSGRAATAALYVDTSWPELGDNPDRTADQPNDAVLGQEVDPSKPLRLVPGMVVQTGAPVRSSPAVSNLVAYVGNDAGDVDAISTTTGGLLWQAKTGGPVHSSPVIDPNAGLVIVGSSDGNVYALTVKTGATAWQTATGGAVTSSPAIVNGVVYVGSSDGKLYALNETTGAKDWSSAAAGKITTAPAADAANNEVVVGDAAGDVTAFAAGDAGGKVLWTRPLGRAAGTPLISGGMVFVGSADGKEYALNEATGSVDWSARLSGTPSPAATLNGTLFVGTSAHDLYGLKAATGAVSWKRSGEPGAATGIAVTGGILFVEYANGKVGGYRPTGFGTWTAQTGAGLYGTPAIVDNAVIVGAGDGSLYVYTPFGLPMI